MTRVAEAPIAVPYSRGPARLALLTNPEDAQAAAEALAQGAVIGQGFANFYVLTTRPGAETVGKVNLMKGRPVD